MKRTLFSVLVALLSIKTSSATYGVDLSTLASSSSYTCLRNNGMSFAIPRAYCSFGGCDGNINANLANAHAAGMPYVDVYMFPCRGKSATDQVNQMFSCLGNGDASVTEVPDDVISAKGMSAGRSSDYSVPSVSTPNEQSDA